MGGSSRVVSPVPRHSGMVLIEARKLERSALGIHHPAHPGFHRLSASTSRSYARQRPPRSSSASFRGLGQDRRQVIHPFGMTGKSTWSCNFHHFWLHSLARGIKSEYGEFCLEHQASQGRQVLHRAERRDQLSLPPGRRHLCQVLRKFSEKSACAASRARQGSPPERGIRFHRVTGARFGPGVEGDLFIELHRLPRLLKSGRSRRLRGLEPMVALRQRGGGADRIGPGLRCRTRAPSRTKRAGAGAFRCNTASAHGLVYSSQQQSDQQPPRSCCARSRAGPSSSRA